MKNNYKIQKRKATALFIALLMMSSALLLMLPTQAQILAQNQPIPGPLQSGISTASVNTVAHLSARPNPIGLNQLLLINIWLTPAPGANRFYPDFTITLTKPDGQEEVVTMDSYVADGTAWFEWMPDQVGTWTIKFEFPGVYYPAGRYLDGQVINATSGGTNYSDSVYYKPDTAPELKITVQEDLVYSWPEMSLPTDYWTRPIAPELREWAPIIGNYPWRGPGGGSTWDEYYPDTNPYWSLCQDFTPWVQAPSSAHIVWKREYATAGLLGGDEGTNSVYWPLTTWNIKPSIIFNGKAYQTVTKPAEDGPSGATYWQCYDIRTGEIYWERQLYAGESAPDQIEYGIGSLLVPGVQPKTETPYLLSISNGYLRKYEPTFGTMVLNVSIAPMTGSGGTYYMNGYGLGIQDLGSAAGSERYRLINWTTQGTNTNFAQRVISNTTYARSNLPSGGTTDWQSGAGAVVTTVSAGGAYEGQTIVSYNLLTGEQLWNKTIDEPSYSSSSNLADHGKVAVLSANGYYIAYDLWTGTEVWRTEQFDYPWDSGGWGTYSTMSAYGNIYWVAQTGIYSIDWDTGDINWKFEALAPTPFESHYTGENGTTVMPYHAPGMIADGKIFIYDAKHSPEMPYYRGLRTRCINATTGEEIWSIGISGAGQHGRDAKQLAVADGYLTLGARDGYMYVFGKGQSETTVTAPDVAVTLGNSIMIKGSVLDLSPAQPYTPCVSKESMDLQMEYLHVQMPIDGIWGNRTMVGIPVSLDAVDPNGNYIHIGDVTTDGYSGEFGFTWEPKATGQYTITATFLGDESYGSSFATTFAIVSDTPVETPAPTLSITMPPFELYTAASAIAIILAIAIAVLLLRKRP
ncbi:MAG: PQQ-binding-like beta-propeller repeat protein [Candidatus Bathyarchaeia archaeon]